MFNTLYVHSGYASTFERYTKLIEKMKKGTEESFDQKFIDRYIKDRIADHTSKFLMD